MPIVRLPKGQLRDEIRQPIYDTINIAAATSPVGIHRFFSAVQGKTKAQSNLRQNNLLETAVSYRCQGLGIDAQNYFAANISALPVIMENSSLSLTVGEKVYWEGPLTFLAGRVNAYYDNSAAAACYERFGDVAVQSVILKGKHVVDINPLQSFNGTWIVDNMAAAKIALCTPAAATDLNVILSLKGLLRRPVQ